jgi:putative membrane protein
VTITAAQSDSYGDIALVWSALVALLALSVVATFAPFYLGLIDRITGSWDTRWTPRHLLELAALIAALKFTGMWLLQLWRPLRRWLVPRAVMHARVRARAVMLFRVGVDARTSGRTGILIYLSEAERRAEIVADEGISAKVSPEIWGEAMAALLSELSAGRAGAGLIAAVERVGAVLAEHCPRAADDVNELPDRLIEV